MTQSEKLTPDFIRQILTEEEIPLRGRTFTPDAIAQILRYGAIVGSSVEQHNQMPRGMKWARELIQKTEEKNLSFPSGAVILADEMVQSRGRFNRSWHAPQGGLWLTLVMVNTLLPAGSFLVPLAAGVACCELLRYYGLPAHIKWVNDILVDRKKISGILTESFTGPRSGEEYFLIGIGINVNNEEFPAELSEHAIALKSCLHQEISVPEMAARLLVKLRWNIGLLYYEEARHLQTHGGIAHGYVTGAENESADAHLLLQSYKSLTDVINRRVLFGFNVQENPLFEARVVALDNSGGLILELDDASTMVHHSGEITYLD